MTHPEEAPASSYRNLAFSVIVDEESEGAYVVRSQFGATAAVGSFDATLPLVTKDEITNALEWIKRGFIDPQYASELGARLFDTLFPDAIHQAYIAALNSVRPNGLHVVLHLPTALSALPWELLYDREHLHDFLALSATAPLSRAVAGAPIPNRPPAHGPIRILIATASPLGYPPVSHLQEAAAVESVVHGANSHATALPGLPASLAVQVARFARRHETIETRALLHASAESLEAELTRAAAAGRPYHVIHLACHGMVREAESFVLLEQPSTAQAADAQPAQEITVERLARIVARPEVMLVFLNACQTASPLQLTHGVAEEVMLRGVPAVVGMRLEVLDADALRFAASFYTAWAAGVPVESALASARRLYAERARGAAADWSVPLLYLGPGEALQLRIPYARRQLPWPVRVGWRTIVAFFALIAALSSLLAFPGMITTVLTSTPGLRCWYALPFEGQPISAVVTAFTQEQADGTYRATRASRRLSGYLYRFFEGGLPALEAIAQVPIATRGPSQSCPVSGDDDHQRDRAADVYAERVKATLVIYGVLEEEEGRQQIRVFVRVPPEPQAQVDAITGPLQMGRPVPYAAGEPLPQDHVAGRVMKVLGLITAGLWYVFNDEPVKAVPYYESAAQIGGDSLPGAENIYLLIGNAHVRQASLERGAVSTATSDAAEEQFVLGLCLGQETAANGSAPAAEANRDAEQMARDAERLARDAERLARSEAALALAAKAYDHALAIDPDFARARMGVASITYQQAIGDLRSICDPRTPSTLLDQAQAEFEDAAAMASTPEQAIGPKVELMLGQIDQVRACRGEPQAWASAQAHYQAVIDEYEQTHSEFVAESAGHANARLGSMAQQTCDLKEAAADYERAAPLVTNYYRALYLIQAGDLFRYMGDDARAHDTYAEAWSAASGIDRALTDEAERKREMTRAPTQE